MSRQELIETLTGQMVVEDFIEEATAYAHRRCPEVPANVDAYGDNKFWGACTAYLVAKSRQI